jgi:hypothetical protein
LTSAPNSRAQLISAGTLFLSSFLGFDDSDLGYWLGNNAALV